TPQAVREPDMPSSPRRTASTDPTRATTTTTTTTPTQADPSARAQQTTPAQRAREQVRDIMKGDSWKSPEGAKDAADKIKKAVEGLPQHERESILRDE